jgi:DNA integrity scanning protein DisA with diadenylate cyclase activity
MKRSELKSIVNEVLSEARHPSWDKVVTTMDEVRETLEDAIDDLEDIEGTGKMIKALKNALHEIKAVS